MLSSADVANALRRARRVNFIQPAPGKHGVGRDEVLESLGVDVSSEDAAEVDAMVEELGGYSQQIAVPRSARLRAGKVSAEPTMTVTVYLIPNSL